jgi:hypothetical protein
MNYENINQWPTGTTFEARERQLWLVAIVLLAIDVATTWYVVSRYGVVAEGNPVMATVMEATGFHGLLWSKVFVFGLGLVFRELVSSNRWVVPFGIIVPMIPVAVLNVGAVLALVL